MLLKKRTQTNLYYWLIGQERLQFLWCHILTHWGRDNLATIFQTTFFKCIFLNENAWISLKISQKFVLEFRINNIPVLVQIMDWRRSGDKPLSEPMMVSLPMHICVTWPQWVIGQERLQFLWCHHNALITSELWFHILDTDSTAENCDFRSSGMPVARWLPWTSRRQTWLCSWTRESLSTTETAGKAWFGIMLGQWETVLLCNNVSHRLGASLESALSFPYKILKVRPFFKLL